MKIYLLVEDCQDDVFLTEHAFLRSGMARKAKLRIVRDGLQAIDYVQGVPPYDNRATFPFPDYILADIKMPPVCHDLNTVRPAPNIAPGQMTETLSGALRLNCAFLRVRLPGTIRQRTEAK